VDQLDLLGDRCRRGDDLRLRLGGAVDGYLLDLVDERLGGVLDEVLVDLFSAVGR